ncbi:MAG TPA: peptidoglycan-binding protein [Coleofasciculaceae cyanobacterium]
MESLAYLYWAQDYENPEDKPIALLKNSAGFAASEHLAWPKAAALGMAGVLCCPGVVGLSQVAQAQTYSSEGLYPSSIYAFEDSSTPYASGSVNLTPSSSYRFSYDGYAYVRPDSGLGYRYPCSNNYPGSSGYLPVRPATPSRPGSLSVGDSGDAVRQLQDLLRNAGYFSSPSTGYFGTTTESAVMAFQQDAGLVADGVAGSRTIAALQGSDYRPIRPGSNLLQYGDRGAQVSQLQSALKSLGYYSGTIDGVFGTSTEVAVQTFQLDYGLSADGVVGSVTQRKLQTLVPGLA